MAKKKTSGRKKKKKSAPKTDTKPELPALSDRTVPTVNDPTEPPGAARAQRKSNPELYTATVDLQCRQLVSDANRLWQQELRTTDIALRGGVLLLPANYPDLDYGEGADLLPTIYSKPRFKLESLSDIPKDGSVGLRLIRSYGFTEGMMTGVRSTLDMARMEDRTGWLPMANTAPRAGDDAWVDIHDAAGEVVEYAVPCVLKTCKSYEKEGETLYRPVVVKKTGSSPFSPDPEAVYLDAPPTITVPGEGCALAAAYRIIDAPGMVDEYPALMVCPPSTVLQTSGQGSRKWKFVPSRKLLMDVRLLDGLVVVPYIGVFEPIEIGPHPILAEDVPERLGSGSGNTDDVPFDYDDDDPSLPPLPEPTPEPMPEPEPEEPEPEPEEPEPEPEEPEPEPEEPEPEPEEPEPELDTNGSAGSADPYRHTPPQEIPTHLPPPFSVTVEMDLVDVVTGNVLYSATHTGPPVDVATQMGQRVLHPINHIAFNGGGRVTIQFEPHANTDPEVVSQVRAVYRGMLPFLESLLLDHPRAKEFLTNQMFLYSYSGLCQMAGVPRRLLGESGTTVEGPPPAPLPPEDLNAVPSGIENPATDGDDLACEACGRPLRETPEGYVCDNGCRPNLKDECGLCHEPAPPREEPPAAPQEEDPPTPGVVPAPTIRIPLPDTAVEEPPLSQTAMRAKLEQYGLIEDPNALQTKEEAAREAENRSASDILADGLSGLDDLL